jgi:hypothetical protein
MQSAVFLALAAWGSDSVVYVCSCSHDLSVGMHMGFKFGVYFLLQLTDCQKTGG